MKQEIKKNSGGAKIIHEIKKCIGCGSCVALCPEYWEMAEVGKVHLLNSKKNPKTGNYELEGVKKIFDKGGRKCDTCGREHEIYAIIDSVWFKYCNKTDYICLDCFEKRLGRRITKIDLKNVQCNEFLFKLKCHQQFD